jgi:hypothetical protein
MHKAAQQNNAIFLAVVADALGDNAQHRRTCGNGGEWPVKGPEQQAPCADTPLGVACELGCVEAAQVRSVG